ncbi:class I adenylate-forming enzyme family protein [Mycolicibacterium monacense]|uniref:AMP-dependent synthetase and ligase n=1 Tax=Mycobacterium sp. (strain JLS) TaxID=164757 RepID=A0A5Q5CH17_MYCSJ|nr:AMP-dependent synthetase [Mycolicibacterium monacense DSM 44395]ORB19778.1 AMP-dependent synthetase [Mycolicibacterium monacense DSM 44395]QHP86408.1 long-chain fatty acid--CoA ligase [Mycolicibacterium monacense DSM 44395]
MDQPPARPRGGRCDPVGEDRQVIPPRPTIPALLARSAREFGDQAYVISPTERLTYGDAERRSAEVARWLLGRGVGKGVRVGLFFPNGVDWIVWWLAVSRIGALAVPLSTMYTPAELAKVVRLADVALVVGPSAVLGIDVAQRFEEAFPGLADQPAGRLALTQAPYLRSVVLTGGADRPWVTPHDSSEATVSREVLAAVEDEVSPADLAVMVHTSGSTADPKGVLHTHGTVVRQTSGWPAAVRAVTGSAGPVRILCAMPFFWIGGLLAATGALHEPVTVLVLPRLDAQTALDLIERERATGLVGWPAFTQRLRDHPSFAARDLSSAPMLRDGPLDIAMTDVPDGYPVHRTMSETAGGFAFTEMAIVDDEGQAVPEGTVGELLVRGIGVMAGYNKRERAETFDADGWYHTGDRVYRREGDPRLFYVGRTSELIKAAGANVSPLEVEAVVEQFPDVVQCVVVGVDDPERGEQVCAAVVPARGEVDVTDLSARARTQLSAYKVPTRWAVVGADQLPVLASGKLDRKAVKKMIADGVLPSVAPT